MKRIISILLIPFALVSALTLSSAAEAAKPPTGSIVSVTPAAPSAGDSVAFVVDSNADNEWVSVFCWEVGSVHSSETLLFGSQQSQTLGFDTFGPLPGPSECIAEFWTFVQGHPPTHKFVMDEITFDVS